MSDPREITGLYEIVGVAVSSLSAKPHFITELKELIEKLEGQIQDYRRTKFGPKSEKLDPAQLELALEDLETAIAETQAQIAIVEEKIAASATDPEKAAPSKQRKARALPQNLPRVERVIEPDSIACPCGCGNKVRIGEDRTERLDFIPARYQVIVTIRPKYACPKGRIFGSPPKAGRHDVAYMLARDCLFPWLTAVQNAEFGARIRHADRHETHERALHLLEAVGLKGFEDNYPKALSHGMRQRVALARTFCLDSPLLLMDEPFGALDAQTKMQLEDAGDNPDGVGQCHGGRQSAAGRDDPYPWRVLRHWRHGYPDCTKSRSTGFRDRRLRGKMQGLRVPRCGAGDQLQAGGFCRGRQVTDRW